MQRARDSPAAAGQHLKQDAPEAKVAAETLG